MRRIASRTGGQLYRSTPEASELTALIEEVSALGGREIDAREVTQYEEQFQIFLGAAILLLFLEGLWTDRKKTVSAWRGRFT